MAIWDVLMPVFGEEADETALAAVTRLSVFKDAHIAALLLAPLPEPILAGDGVGVGVAMTEVFDQVHIQAEAARKRLEGRLADRRFDVRIVEAWTHLAAETAAIHARHADIAVLALGNVESSSSPRRDVVEAMLMESGRPILAIPTTWTVRDDMKRVMIAWDGGREAARAIGDAAPFLDLADEVVVATIDAQPKARGVGPAPGADIAAHLARRGYSVEVKNFDDLGEETGDALLTAALAAGADLIVMGGYGHARLQQAIFGGVTKTLLEGSDIPLLLSH